jgi:inosine/xanthosine triphosphate pyrophosphatase family protein
MQAANKKVPITFITGNKKKLEEFMQIMTGKLGEAYEVTNKGIDLEEIQGSPEEIVMAKIKLAC